jgi:hypothetical protein
VRASALEHGVNHPLVAIHTRRITMRKFGMLIFMLLITSVLAVPAFAQGTAAVAGGTNWVAITSGFAIALAAGLAGLGQ